MITQVILSNLKHITHIQHNLFWSNLCLNLGIKYTLINRMLFNLFEDKVPRLAQQTLV